MIGRWCGASASANPSHLSCQAAFTFIAHYGFVTQILAHMLDSLVRVSRRADYSHFVSILTAHGNYGVDTGQLGERALPTPPRAACRPDQCSVSVSLSRGQRGRRRAITLGDPADQDLVTFPTRVSASSN